MSFFTSGSLPFPKYDLNVVPATMDPTRYIRKIDWNAYGQRLDDLSVFAASAGVLASTGSAGVYNSNIQVNSLGQVTSGSTAADAATISASYAVGAAAADSTLILDRVRTGLSLKINVPAFAENPFQILSGSTTLLYVDSTGSILGVSGSSLIGSPAFPFGTIYSITSRAQNFDTPTTNQTMFIAATNANAIQMARVGVDIVPGGSGSVLFGRFTIPWSNVISITGSYQLLDTATTNLLTVAVQGTRRWEFNNAGTFYPIASGTQQLGSSTLPIANVTSITGSYALDQAIHFKGLGAAPSGSLGSGAGTAGSYTFSGSDSAHLLTVAVGTSPTPGTALITGTFNQTYNTAPNGINLEPANAAACQAMSGVYVDSNSVFALTGSAYVIKTVGAALTPSTTFKFWVSVIA